MKNILILIALLITLNSFSQNNNKDIYYPISKKSTWKYNFVNSTNWMKYKIINDNVKKNGKTYSKKNISYSWGGNSDSYTRYDDNGNLFIFSIDQDLELIKIPKDLIPGYKWSHNDGWEFQIIGINEELKTPTENYTHLLQIEAIQIDHKDKSKGEEYYLFYKKGVGQVASIMNGKLQTYLVKYNIN